MPSYGIASHFEEIHLHMRELTTLPLFPRQIELLVSSPSITASRGRRRI